MHQELPNGVCKAVWERVLPSYQFDYTLLLVGRAGTPIKSFMRVSYPLWEPRQNCPPPSFHRGLSQWH